MEPSVEDEDNMRGYSPEGIELLTGSSGVLSASPPEVKPDHRRCIVHFDIDSFYAQVEEVLDPRLRGKPIGIRQKYLLVTCNYTARRLGAKKMENAAEAKRRCPSLIVMDGEDLTRYREASETIFSFIAGKCGPLVQRLGMDEIFADVTELIGSRLATEAANGNNNFDVPSSRATREESGEATGTRERSPAFTGHLYAPGTGGRLLEAQTGVEISLGYTRDATLYGVCPRDDGIREDAAWSPPCGPERTVPTSSVGNADHLAPEGTRENDGNAYASDLEPGRCSCGCVNRLAAASAFAERIRRCLRDDVGYTCSAGIGCSKAAAKLAGELHKPDQQTTILPWHVKSLFSQLPLRKLPGCGYSTCAKIKSELGVTEVRQLQRSPWPILVRIVGDKLARVLYLLCRGEDPTPVAPSARPKTMSDEDSFKRGSVRSREKVETNIRRLAASLLVRAGERVRLHKEAPTNLRLGVRRASKGYGHRITRQCAIPSGVAVAWGDIGDDVAAAAASGAGGLPEAWKAEGAAKAKAVPAEMSKSQQWNAVHPPDPTATREAHHDSDENGVDVVLLPDGPRPSPSGVASESAAPVLAEEPQSGRLPKPSGVLGHGESCSSAAEEALSEVVRLAMGMLDRICSAEERLDITLLSVGFARFHNLGGSAQTGMARYLATPAREGRRVARRTDNRLCASAESWDSSETHVPHPASIPRGTGKRSLGMETPATERVSIATSENLEYSENVNRDSKVGDVPPHSGGQSRKKVSRYDDASSNHDDGPLSSGASPRTKQPQTDKEGRVQGSAGREGGDGLQDGDRQRGERGRERLPRDDGAPEDAERTLEDDAYAKIWEKAEVLMVDAEGGDVPGRGRLNWCRPCKAYVLREDAEEHASSEFHAARLRLYPGEERPGFEESKSSAGGPDCGGVSTSPGAAGWSSTMDRC